jgi:hemerythrin-like domain-containing protein
MNTIERRAFLVALPAAGISLAAAGLSAAGGRQEEKVTPAEDLMREHGVLKRILLIYEEVGARIAARKDFPPAALAKSAHIIRTFIEGYHEKLEEEHLFPRFRKAHKLVELVETLDLQHKAGRRVTEHIIALASVGLRKEPDKAKLATALHAFGRMYGPHEAREDTVLFPAIHTIVSAHEYGALGEEFEKKEHQLFGRDGFQGMVAQVAAIEKDLGIFDLDRFTPK